MTEKLIMYVFVYVVATLLAIYPIKVKEMVFFVFWFAVALGLSSAIHSTDLVEDSDFATYMNVISSSNFDLEPRYAREFIFWILSRSLYDTFGNKEGVFFFLDSILLGFLYKGIKLNQSFVFANIDGRNLRYMFFGLLLFFPFLAGMHGLYRQILATAIFICAVGYAGTGRLYKGILLLLISFFVHNIVAIFIPLILFYAKNKYYRCLSIIIATLTPLILIFSEGSSSEYLTRHDIFYGGTLAYTFLITFYFFLLMAVLLNRLTNSGGVIRYGVFERYLFLSVFIYCLVFFSLKSNLSIERVGLFIFMLIFFLLSFFIEFRLKNKVIFRLIYLNISMLPLFTFYSAYLN